MGICASLDKQSRLSNVENKTLQKRWFSTAIEYPVTFFTVLTFEYFNETGSFCKSKDLLLQRIKFYCWCFLEMSSHTNKLLRVNKQYGYTAYSRFCWEIAQFSQLLVNVPWKDQNQQGFGFAFCHIYNLG